MQLSPQSETASIIHELSKIAIVILNFVRFESPEFCSQFSQKTQVLFVFNRFQIRFTAVTDGWYKTNKLQKVCGLQIICDRSRIFARR
jgi:hypothetical protein